jgi:V/A-type H+/Na+-transporting ATPase subunit F
MNRVVFITPHDARYGFSLSGALQHVTTPEDVEAAVRKAVADPDSGVVIIDERLVGAIGDERFREMEQRYYGVLLVLPAPERYGGVEGYAERLIRRVIGYQVRLNL